MNTFFWNAYKRLEKEVLALSEDIHCDDDQLGVYSSRIGDLLVRTVIEIESLSKALYFANGGKEPEDGGDLYFDTICLKDLEDKWLLSKKKVVKQTLAEKMNNGEYPTNNAELNRLVESLFAQNNSESFKRVGERHIEEINRVYSALRYEAVLNKNQY